MPKLILVTGGAGFIGSHLCERLVADGHTVISLDNYFTGSRENHVPGVKYREGHTKDIEQLIPETPDLVYHLGEYSRVEKSFEDVEVVWDLNKTGTFAVLEFVRRRGSKLVYAGSSTKFSDGGLGRDQSPYAWTKAANTELVRNYATWFGIKYAITYFYNVYGPRERAGAYGTVIEIFKRSRAQQKPLAVVAPGTQERNFTHVHDIVDGLILVGEKGEGDEYGLGDTKPYSILDVAQMFNGEILMLPERAGNRMSAEVVTDKSEALGWKTTRHLAEYIQESLSVMPTEPVKPTEPRVLVFTTTFHPILGPAEQAVLTLAEQMPEVQFDIVTAAHSKEAKLDTTKFHNISIYRIGWGSPFDKFLLPMWGAREAQKLTQEHAYFFSWSVMASYGTLAALRIRRKSKLPLLVTLADQKLTWYQRMFLRFILGRADQIYTTSSEQRVKLASLQERMRERKSLGEGDSLANAMRFAYSTILSRQKK